MREFQTKQNKHIVNLSNIYLKEKERPVNKFCNINLDDIINQDAEDYYQIKYFFLKSFLRIERNYKYYTYFNHYYYF